MKTELHPASSRGTADYGWLKATYSFSFSNFYDPTKIHFGALRVLNDDYIEGGMGFGKHPHDNMEIVTIPLKGAVAHEDSTGMKGIVKAGDVQIMSAGSGIVHSEKNASHTDPLQLFQIWVVPKLKNIPPRYDQKSYLPEAFKNQWKTIVSPLGSDIDSLQVNQDAYFNVSHLDDQKSLDYDLYSDKHGIFIMVIEGEISVEGQKLGRRDAIGISEIESVNIEATKDSEILLIEVPMKW